MSEHNISVQAGQSLRLLTAGKYCDRDIVVTAEGSGGGDGRELDALLDGTLENLNSNVVNVTPHACRGLTNLTAVNLPVATEIGTYSFNGCTNLTSFNAPMLETLGTYALVGSMVTEVAFPHLTSLGEYAFNNCGSLIKADIGMAASVPRYAFGSCKSLTTLIVRKTSGVASLVSTAFNSANFTGYIYVPAALVEDYKTASIWSAHASRIRAIEDYPEVCEN